MEDRAEYIIQRKRASHMTTDNKGHILEYNPEKGRYYVNSSIIPTIADNWKPMHYCTTMSEILDLAAYVRMKIGNRKRAVTRVKYAINGYYKLFYWVDGIKYGHTVYGRNRIEKDGRLIQDL